MERMEKCVSVCVSRNVLLKFVAAVKTQSHDSLSARATSAIAALLKPSRHINAFAAAEI